ncbi:hypothetical protein LVJ78_03460 [Uruburuella suis]|uniref:Factor H binding protein-like C-terminal domain-containing protein n=1 Tax=Uruburuella suis TaxID=252130 RepID=A0AAE9GZS0_9NEIS|nr:factor H binding protein domain-containing protein [Uruburuella suis]TCP06002.1 hypothetical protein EV680_11559 [Uruburuella suis]UOO80081.1 hypothetical protein LVJ78_03460 [Uruburuella suis]
MNMLKCSMWAMMVGLTACGGGGGGSGVAGSQPDTGLSALNAVPEAYRAQVRQAKLWEIDVEYAGSNVAKEAFGQTYAKGNEKIDLTPVPLGLHDYPFKDTERYKGVTFTALFDNKTQEIYHQRAFAKDDVRVVEGTLRLYQQPYSVVIGSYMNNFKVNNEPVTLIDAESSFTIENILGLATTKTAIDALNIHAVYRGEAFTAKDKGTLVYNVDFKNRIGSGEITGLGQFGRVVLEKGDIEKFDEFFDSKQAAFGISSTARAEKSNKQMFYGLMFAGPQAEEVSGLVIQRAPEKSAADIIGFGGKR